MRSSKSGGASQSWPATPTTPPRWKTESAYSPEKRSRPIPSTSTPYAAVRPLAYTVDYHPIARQQADTLPTKARQDFAAAVETIAADPWNVDGSGSARDGHRSTGDTSRALTYRKS